VIPDEIVKLRWERHRGALLRELAKKYGVSEGHVSQITTGKIHSNIGGPITNRQEAQTRCAHGHDYTPENIIVKHGRRNCRRCKNDLENARKKKARAEAKVRPSRG